MKWLNKNRRALGALCCFAKFMPCQSMLCIIHALSKHALHYSCLVKACFCITGALSKSMLCITHALSKHLRLFSSVSGRHGRYRHKNIMAVNGNIPLSNVHASLCFLRWSRGESAEEQQKLSKYRLVLQARRTPIKIQNLCFRFALCRWC